MTWYRRILRENWTARLYGAGLILAGCATAAFFLLKTASDIRSSNPVVIYARGGIALSMIFFWVGVIHLFAGRNATRFLQISMDQSATRLQQITVFIGVLFSLGVAAGFERFFVVKYFLTYLS